VNTATNLESAPCSNDIPKDLSDTIESATRLALNTPGFLAENEIRFLGTLAVCTPASGAIVEIGSFKGKSTVMLATMARKYGLGRVVAIDPHQGLSYLGPDMPQQSPTLDEFLANIKSAGLDANVEVQRGYSREVARDWRRPIRLLWIDGDHSYKGCKEDFELFSPYLAEGAVVAFHDTLNIFEGPIRVFVEEVLRSDRFGSSGFVHSIAWSQFRPKDGASFRKSRAELENRCAKLIPLVLNGGQPTGWRKKWYKLLRSRVPRKLVSPEEWVALLGQTR
jgi:MMP 1-O-methyltransferase